MRVGTFVAALVALGIFIVGSVTVASLRGADLGSVSGSLFLRTADPSLLKTGLAWAWLSLGVAGIAGAFAAFVVLEGDDMPKRIPHRRFPKALPPILLGASLGVLWLMLAPAGDDPPIDAAVRPPVTLPDDKSLDVALAGGDAAASAPSDEAEQGPVIDPTNSEAATGAAPPPAPSEIEQAATTSRETTLFWTYEYPYVREGRIVSSEQVDRDLATLIPMDDPDGSVAKMLCGNVWLAFSGSASEEGPLERNAVRARARAELLATRAIAWLDAHPDCERPVVLALDLGQHVGTGARDARQTAYQRQAIIVSRARANPAERLSPSAARAELEAFYEDGAMRARLLGARRFKAPPAIFVPSGG